MSGEEAPALAETPAQPLEAMDLMTVLQNRGKWKKQQQLGEINQRIQNQ